MSSGNDTRGGPRIDCERSSSANLRQFVERRSQRRKTLMRGRIYFNLARSTLDVGITNVSASGAKLRLATPWPCPKLFKLDIFDPKTGQIDTRRCEVVWQKGPELGVRYLA
jgi:hypothetical protein